MGTASKETSAEVLPISRTTAIAVVVVAVVPLVFGVLGAFSDLVALRAVFRLRDVLAVATGAAAAVVFLKAWSYRRRGFRVPVHLYGAVALAVVVSFTALPSVVRVVIKTSVPDIQTAAATARERLDLRGGTWTDLRFISEDLTKSDLSNSVIQNSDFRQSNLSESDLRESEWVDVNMSGVSLCGADLRGADLRNAKNLDHVSDWSFAYYNSSTLWPEDFYIDTLAGPVAETTRSLLYSCNPSETARIDPEPGTG